MKRWLFAVCCLFLFLVMTPVHAATSLQHLLIINKKSNEMAYYKDGKWVKTFPVATGRKPAYTPEGTFTVVNKIKNRPYYTKNIKGGDPKNPLGDRWLGLDALGTKGTTYAIHGNNDESSIGKYVSSGCIRMHNKDVRWLFDQIPVGTKVVIVTSRDTFGEIAQANGFKVEAEKVVPVTVELDVKKKTHLYQKATKASQLGYVIAPQRVKAIEQSRDWYRIKTWFGSAWLPKEHVAVAVTAKK